MELRVETIRCQSCGTRTELPPHRQVVRCPNCHQQIAIRPNPAGFEGSDDNPVRDFVLRVYCRAMIGLLIYVLSTGPMYWLVYEAFNASGSTFLAKLYYPIALACEASDTICTWFDWYVGLWVF